MGSDRKELTQRYFTSVATTYSEQSETGWWGWWRRTESSAILPALELHPKLHCLEIGCGAGFYGLRLKGLSATYVGVDENLAMVEAARAAGLNVECSEWENFVTDKRFDRVLAAGIIEFTDKPGELLKKISSILLPGGIAVLLYPPDNFFGASYSLWHQLRGCPVSIVKAGEWESLLAAAGLEILEQRKVTAVSSLLIVKKSRQF
jgi:SAM-dependent methyltransferase